MQKLVVKELGIQWVTFGLGERNDRRERLVDWCREKGLPLMNTWFELHPPYRYTWISPGDRARNQIDYILLNERYRSAVSKVKTYLGADIDSDHVPVVATIKLGLKSAASQARACL